MDTSEPHNSIFKELSDIKANLAVNSAETANIKTSVNEIKTDIRAIKEDFISRREFTEGLVAIREEFSPMKKFVYGLAGFVLITILAALLNLILLK